MSLSMFTSFSSQAEDLSELMASFPEELLEAINAGNIDFGNALEYYGYIYQYILLAACIMAMLLAVSALAKEEGENTIEFLYAKPVTRRSMVLQKLLSVLTQTTVFSLIMTLLAYVLLHLFSSQEIAFKPILLVGIATWLAQLFFIGIGLLISAFVIKTRRYTPIAMGVVMAMYFMGMVASINQEIEILTYTTPFAFFNISQAITTVSLNQTGVLISSLTFIIMVFLAFFMYNKKDFSG
jgi:ABC-2 type transport system permease protein